MTRSGRSPKAASVSKNESKRKLIHHQLAGRKGYPSGLTEWAHRAVAFDSDAVGEGVIITVR
jgi:hypothetical protein